MPVVKFDPDKSQLSLNTMDSTVTRERLKVICKKIMNSVVARSALMDAYAADEQFLIGIMAYDRMRQYIDTKAEITTTMEVFVDSFLADTSYLYARQQHASPNKVRSQLQMIDDNGYALSSLATIDDSKLDLILNVTQDARTGDAYTDERYSINLFNNDSTVIVSANKLRNLQRLYDNVIYPILMYYKLKLGAGGTTLLTIPSGLSADNTLQQRGMACIMSVSGVDPLVILKDLTDRKIEVRFGVARLATGGLYVSLPYTTDEGKYVENQIDYEQT